MQLSLEAAAYLESFVCPTFFANTLTTVSDRSIQSSLEPMQTQVLDSRPIRLEKKNDSL